jgi:V8-like Glu-specific endopeptidase
MRGRGTRADGSHGRRARTGPWAAVLFTLLLAVVAVLWPLASAAPAGATGRFAVSGVIAPGTETPAVGALFTMNGGQLGTHFCTASVVDSPAGDLLITAAHCVQGYVRGAPAGLAFVPGYDDGSAPYGIWMVTRISVESAWVTSADPDDDVAFLTVAQPAGGPVIEEVTGGELLGIGLPPAADVRVTGYPGTSGQPISCQNRTSAFGPGQMQFSCGSFTDGTSGSPFLVPAGTGGTDMVIGVLGGYEQGGDTADVSYAATFGPAVAALYDAAVSQG